MRGASGSILVWALAGLLLPGVGFAGNGVTPRPLSDFLDAQGSMSTFFPPVPNYVGWGDVGFETFALIDYAGLAATWLEDNGGPLLHTHVGGNVKERETDDGAAEITVNLHTANALSFAQSGAELVASNFDFLNTPTIFGEKAQDVLAGAAPSTGWASLRLTFTIDAPGDDLPDLEVLLNNPSAYAPVSFDFKSQAIGTRPDGTRARLVVHQVASTNEEDLLVFTVEVIEIQDLGPPNAP
ncbi:hypothetical protein [Nannocystis punicea]|uniref:Secreted protein n=1 Tax=Nannocystis punicea TaxID=2995304 RepID=A0ABY7GXM7_9BACT|nr:hypothetical protein [Nannocystis poenicansa]WAS91711.1 hypothetical protein O0S08_36480 [Nannocystis poenicansa]